MCFSAICVGEWNCLIQIRPIRDVPRRRNGGFATKTFYYPATPSPTVRCSIWTYCSDAIYVVDLLFNIALWERLVICAAGGGRRRGRTCRRVNAFHAAWPLAHTRRARKPYCAPLFIVPHFPARRMFSVNGKLAGSIRAANPPSLQHFLNNTAQNARRFNKGAFGRYFKLNVRLYNSTECIMNSTVTSVNEGERSRKFSRAGITNCEGWNSIYGF